LSASAINHNTRKTLVRYWRLAATGDRKSIGSNFGCGFQLSGFRFPLFRPFLFPIIQRQHGDKAKAEIKKAESGNQTRIAQINSVNGS
jgi:hypothetical protein